VNYS
jgi:outer membrane usher protein FimD/PapC